MTGKTEPTDQEILDRLASWIVTRRMTAPAILLLESHRPLSFVGSQALIVASPIVSFFEPFLKGLVGPGFEHDLYERFASMMEDRENLERLIIAIERKNQEARAAEKEQKRRRKALRREARRKARALRAVRGGARHPRGP